MDFRAPALWGAGFLNIEDEGHVDPDIGPSIHLSFDPLAVDCVDANFDLSFCLAVPDGVYAPDLHERDRVRQSRR